MEPIHQGADSAMSSPTLTVVMPVYNERATLRTAVERMLKTSVPVPYELLVIDDGSTDACIETIIDLVDSEQVRVIRCDNNRGKGSALRLGFEQAAGAY